MGCWYLVLATFYCMDLNMEHHAQCLIWGYDGSTKLPPQRLLSHQVIPVAQATEYGVKPEEFEQLFDHYPEIIVLHFEAVKFSELSKDRLLYCTFLRSKDYFRNSFSMYCSLTSPHTQTYIAVGCILHTVPNSQCLTTSMPFPAQSGDPKQSVIFNNGGQSDGIWGCVGAGNGIASSTIFWKATVWSIGLDFLFVIPEC